MAFRKNELQRLKNDDDDLVELHVAETATVRMQLSLNGLPIVFNF